MSNDSSTGENGVELKEENSEEQESINLDETTLAGTENFQIAERVVTRHFSSGIIITIVVGVIILIYLGGSFYFMNHYFFHTEIAGVDYSCKNKEKVEQLILNPQVDFSVTLLGRENTSGTFSTNDLDMKYVFDDTLQQINGSQNGLEWPVYLFKDNHFTLPVYLSYDQDQLKKMLEALSIFNTGFQRKPVNASISEFNLQSGKYSILQEDKGTTLSIQNTLNTVEESFKTMALGDDEVVIDLDATGCYYNPTIYSDNEILMSILDEMNKYVASNIVYDWNGTEEIIDGAVISDWLSTDGNKVNIDETAVRSFIDMLSKKNDTYGKVRSFLTTSGVTLDLRSGGYGWKTDREAETQALLEEIKNGEIIKKEPLYQCVGFVKGQNDVGNSYVEINLGIQHLYLYMDGNIIFETDFVSGNISNGCGTPAGVFGITYKTKDAVLSGDNYETPVNYWMPFNGNVGMHDATWRSRFGGNIYQTSGSHGCINLPLSSAEYIYSYVKKGFPVVCYY